MRATLMSNKHTEGHALKYITRATYGPRCVGEICGLGVTNITTALIGWFACVNFVYLL